MKKMLLGVVLVFSCLLFSCNDNSSSGPDKREGGGIEVPCNAENEGEVVNPADSNKEYVCKDGSWDVVDPPRHCEDCKDEAIFTSGSSSSTNNVILSASEESSSSVKSVILSSDSDELSSSSSSSVIASETKQSSSSGYDNDDSSSSSEEPVESSSSEETKLYLCEDGETHVLDLANCEKVSSSSEAVSSSSDNKPISSSSEVQESSSSEMSSSSVQTESSSSKVESSSSINISSSSIDESSSSEKSSSSLNDGYDAINNTLTDSRDGQVYKTVTIGTQVWMAENLNYLPEDTVGTIWAGKSLCGGGAWKGKIEGDCNIYGRLYEDDFTKKEENINSICPDGWSLPSKKQYEILTSFLGEDAINKMKIAVTAYWSINESTNQSGFSAIPAGYYSSLGFNDMHHEGVSVASFAFVCTGSNDRNVISIEEDESDFWWGSFGDHYHMSVRCIKD